MFLLVSVFDTIYESTFSPVDESNQSQSRLPLKANELEAIRSYAQIEYPPDQAPCEDRFVWLSLHFDGITTNRFGTGRSYEVISVEIKNTPDENHSLRRFCCVLGIMKHELGVPTNQQPYIQAVQPVIQSLVTSGLLGRYYYYDDHWMHVRWGVLVLSGDTKAQEVMSGFTGKQMSKSYSLFSDSQKQMLNAMLETYHPSGRYIANEDNMMITFETPWNRLNTSSMLRFFNIVASGDEKAVTMLHENCDPEGRGELRTLQELITFLGKTRGWHPSAYPTSIAEEVFLRSLLDAAILSTDENCSIPHFCEMQEELEMRKKSCTRQRKRRASTRSSGAEESPSQASAGEASRKTKRKKPAEKNGGVDEATSVEQNLLPRKITSLHDMVKEELERDHQNVESVAERWGRMVERTDCLTSEEKSVAREFFEPFLKVYDTIQREPTVPPFDRHFPILPGLAFALDGMHVGSNFNQQMSKLTSNVVTKSAATLYKEGFDAYAQEMRMDQSKESCFTVDAVHLQRGVQRLRQFIKKHPTYIPWLRADMLAYNNLKKLKSEWQFTMMFCIFFFAYQEFLREELFFVILACFDCLAFLYTARSDLDEIAEVQARFNFFVGHLDNITYPGFLTPTVVNVTEYHASILRSGPNYTYHNFGSESGYRTLIRNDMGGCNPCKTISRRYNILRVSQLFLFEHNCDNTPLCVPGDAVDSSNPLIMGIPSWLVDPGDTRIALENVMEDYQYYKDDSLVYDGFLFELLHHNSNDVFLQLDGFLEKKQSEIDRQFTVTESSTLRESVKWNGVLYHSVFCRKGGKRQKRELKTQQGLTVENLEYGKDCIAVTADKDDTPQVILVLGYIVSKVNGQPYAEAVGILLPTFCGSLVVRRCPRVVLDIDDEDFKAGRYKFVRVSLNRLHIDKAIPFPLGVRTLFFYVNCLILRPSRRIPHSRLFRPKKERKESKEKSEKKQSKEIVTRSRGQLYQSLYEEEKGKVEKLEAENKRLKEENMKMAEMIEALRSQLK